ncbi:MAG: macro domain-containing protein [Spirochaetes bacterium]|nr:macro domain-containing protein [Spirochaetota bacterium]
METILELEGGRLVIAVGDITSFDGIAIVNAANSGLLGGGGVDGAIHRAAGPALLEECRAVRSTQLPEGLPKGQAVATGAGKLRCGRVIHTAGPVWHGGHSGEPGELASCYRACLELARAEGIASIAFPAISTGAFGYPRSAAALIAREQAGAFLRANELPARVVFVFFSRVDAAAFIDATGGR